jgi:predicted MPP superfamily phosphohydrolase
VAADAFTFAAHDIVVEHVSIPLARLNPRLHGFTIAQLTDFHYSAFTAGIIESAVKMTNDLKPDLIALTGDYVTQSMLYSETRDEDSSRAAEPCARLLAKLRAKSGVFAILGNHDEVTNPDFVTNALQQNGIKVLANSSVPIERDDSRLWLAGVRDVMKGEPDLGKTLASIPAGEATVLLAHEPDYADEVRFSPVDLQLSGHSHGGQIDLPFIGPLYLPPLAKKYVAGLRKLGNLTLYTNRGVGTIRIPARLNCPPEVTLFTLVSP